MLADSVGVALLVVLDTLTPAERLAFVLHDLFGMPFDEIGPIADRSSAPHAERPPRQRLGPNAAVFTYSAPETSKQLPDASITLSFSHCAV